MTSQFQQSNQAPLFVIHDDESYDDAVRRTILGYRAEIAKLQEEKRSSSSWKNVLLFVAGLVLYLILISVL